MEIVDAETTEHIDAARALFEEYAGRLGAHLDFQNIEHEFANLPGAYTPPTGRLLLARADDGYAGCVALRPFAPGICELKRLYVRPAFRGQGLGRRLAERLIEQARGIGYKRMRLDTLSTMTAANRLYGSLGFRDIEPYRHNPLDGARFLELTLWP
ncbi:MAG: GNAT family N-acetyltransferase [Phycisphaerae bacterium]|nr:GNAT family N-acetyltransferase [Phycisphaerae bacterium]